MRLLSKVSYHKISWLGTMCELRSTLNVLGILSDEYVEKKNKESVFKVIDLSWNLHEKERRKLSRYNK